MTAVLSERELRLARAVQQSAGSVVSSYEKARKLGDSPRFGVIVFFPYCCAPIVGILLSLCSDFASDVLLPRCLR